MYYTINNYFCFKTQNVKLIKHDIGIENKCIFDAQTTLHQEL